MAYLFDEDKSKLDFEGALQPKLDTLQTAFQNNVNLIYNKFVSQGTTPTAKTPAAISTAVDTLATTKHNAGYNTGYSEGNAAGYTNGLIAGVTNSRQNPVVSETSGGYVTITNANNNYYYVETTGGLYFDIRTAVSGGVIVESIIEDRQVLLKGTGNTLVFNVNKFTMDSGTVKVYKVNS